MHWARWIAMVSCAAVSAASAARGVEPFALHPAPQTQVDWRGAVLIAQDGFTESPGFPDADGAERTVLGPSGEAANAYKSSSDRLDYRREIAVRGDTLELTLRFRLYPYHGGDGVAYAFTIPAERLEGYAFRAITGRPNKQKVVEGTLARAMPDGGVASGVTYLTLTRGSEALTLDFAPQGRGLYCRSYDKGYGADAWVLRKEGDAFIFTIGLAGNWYGGMVTAKCVIRDGQHAYAEDHPEYDDWHYGIVPQTTVALWASEPRPEGSAALTPDAFTEGAKAGWIAPEGLTTADAVLGQMVAGRRGTLRVSCPPGQYVVTLRFGARAPLGPFDVAAAGQGVAKGLRAEAGAVESFAFPLAVGTDGAQLTFDSEQGFGVSAVLFQRLMSPYEAGYILADSIWAVDGLPTPDKAIDPGTPTSGQVAPMLPADEWRWNMAMTNLGPSNMTSRNDIVTYADLERRMQEVVAAGYNTVICNGLHFRLSHLAEMPMMAANMQRIREVAHRYGVRVIEHHDVPILLAHNEGYKTLLSHVDWLERDIRTGKVATEFCINNPSFRQWYYAWFREYVEATGIDGCMLDEVCFFGAEYCGCAHCRAAFTEATGLVLPFSDTGEVFGNKDSALWVAWEQWRIRSSTDFFKEIRAIFDAVNPAASIMSYTTHYGFSSDYASRNSGADLVDRGRYIDMLGTEIMSRNVFDAYRSVFAFRKAKAALGLHYGKPIWGLVYHLDDPNIAYFGWALLHMNRQAGWISSIEGFDLGRFVNWKDRMNARSAQPLSEVAVVFSRACCNYNRRASHPSATMGWVQQLNDAHIQHDVILDLDLAPERLARYRVVILSDLECLGDSAAAALDAFVRQGGTLIATRWSGQSSADGIVRSAPALAQLLGVELGAAPIKGPLEIRPADGEAFAMDGVAARVALAPDCEVVASIVDAAGATIAPAVARRAVGKGQAFYSAVPLGAVNHLRELTAGDTYEFALNAPARALLWQIVRQAAGEAPFTFEAVRVPEQLLVTAYSVPGSYAIHLLNATGVHLAPGDTIPKAKKGEVWPALAEDVVFDLRVPKIAGGRIVSPDYPEAKAPMIEGQPGAYRVTVPKEAIHAYAIVYLDE